MVDFAKLTLEIDSRPVVQGTKALDDMAKSSEKSEASVNKLESVYSALAEELVRTNDQLTKLVASQRTVTTQADQAATSTRSLSDSQERALSTLRSMSEELQTQLDFVGKSNAERELGINLVRAQALVEAAQTEQAQELLVTIERQTQQLQQQNGRRAVADFIEGLEEEVRLSKLSAAARAEELTVLQLIKVAREQGVELSEKELSTTRELVAQLQAARSAPSSASGSAADIAAANEQTQQGVKITDSLRLAVTKLGGAFASVLTVRNAVNTTLDFERGLIAVAGGADIAEEGLADLQQGILTLSRDLATPLQDLLRIGEAAGAVGVKGVPNLLRFVEVAARLQSVSDFGGPKAAEGLSRLLKITGEAPEEVNRLAAVITRVGGASAATDTEVADLAVRLARATTEFKLGSTEAVAFAAALSAVDIPTNTSGSALGRLALAVRTALNEGGTGLEALVQLTRTSADSLRDLFAQDTAAALILVLESLGRLSDSGVEVEQALSKIGSVAPDIAQVVRGLAANSDLLSSSLALARDEAAKQTALTIQSEAAFTTTSAAVQQLANTLRVSVIAQTSFRDAMEATSKVTAGALTELFDLDKGQEETTVSAKILAVALGVVAANTATLAGAAGIRALLSLFPALTATVLAHAAATSAGALATDILVVSLNKLKLAVVSNPLTATLVVVSSLAGAYFALSDSVDTATSSLDDFNVGAAEAEQRIQGIVDSFQDLERLRALRDSALNMSEFADAAALTQREINALKESLVDVRELGDLSGTGRISVANVRELLGQGLSAELQAELNNIIAASERFAENAERRRLEAAGQTSAVPVDIKTDFVQLDVEQVVGVLQKRLDELKELQQEFEAEAQAAREADQAAFSGSRAGRDSAAERNVESLRKISNELELQLKYVNDTNVAREQATFLAQAQALADEAQTEEARQLFELIKARSEELRRQRGEQAIDEFVEGLREEVRLAGLSVAAREEELAVLQLTKTAREQGVEATEQDVEQVRELVRQLQEAQRVREEDKGQTPDTSDFSRGRKAAIQDQFDNIRADLEAEIALIGETNEARERATFSRNLETLAVQAEADGYTELADSIREALPELRASFAELQSLRDVEQGADNVGQAFSRTFSSIVKGSQSASEGLKSLALSLSDLVFKNLALNPLADLVSGAVAGIGSGGFASLFAAKGAVFAGGQALSPGQAQSLLSQGVQGYADGGLINSPIALSAPNGKSVIAGEAGEEAIVPLSRMADGRLGVASQGGSNRSVVNNYTYNETIVTPEPSSFKESSRQRRRAADNAFRQRGR
jgi:TP901 family phage tail tape measure protein